MQIDDPVETVLLLFALNIAYFKHKSPWENVGLLFLLIILILCNPYGMCYSSSV